MKKNSIVKAGFGYTLANILIKGINFLSIPIFSRILSTEDFGIYNVFLAYESIFVFLIGLNMHNSIRSANLEFKGEINQYTSSISIIYYIDAILLFVGLTIINHYFPLFSQKSDNNLIVLLVLYSLGNSIITLYNLRLSLEYRYKTYGILASLSTLINIGLSFILINTGYAQRKYLGRILGTTFSSVIIAIVAILLIYKASLPKYCYRYWKFALKYSLPIVPHGISQVLLAQFDRIMISSMVGNAEAGIYSMGGNIKLIITVLTSSIESVWGTYFFNTMEKQDTESIKKNAKLLILGFLCLSILLMGISPEILLLLGGEKYYDAKHVAIPMIADGFLLFVVVVLVQSEYYKKKTFYITIGTIFTAIINIVLNYWFIRKYGYVAAAYTTLFSYLIYCVYHIIISRKLLMFDIIPLSNLIICISANILLVFLLAAFVENIILRLMITIIVLFFLCFPYRNEFAIELRRYKNRKQRLR